MTYETNKMVGLNNLRLVWKVSHIIPGITIHKILAITVFVLKN